MFGREEFFIDIAEEEDLSRFDPDIMDDSAIGFGFSFGADGCVIVRGEEGEQVPFERMSEKEFLGLAASGGVDSQVESAGFPCSQAGGDFWEEVGLEGSGMEAVPPDPALEGLESGRFLVAIHAFDDVLLSVQDRLIGMGWKPGARIKSCVARHLIEHALEFESPLVLGEKRGKVGSDVSEHDVVDEGDARRRSFNIEQNRVDRKVHRRSLNLDDRIDTTSIFAEIAGAEAEGLVGVLDALFDVVRRPTSGILEESNTPNVSVIAEIEPMFGTAWHIDQIAG